MMADGQHAGWDHIVHSPILCGIADIIHILSVNESVCCNAFPKELSNILYEEMELYLSGSITKDMLIEHLENRIELYLGEKN